jgi:hypothetical protein
MSLERRISSNRGVETLRPPPTITSIQLMFAKKVCWAMSKIAFQHYESKDSQRDWWSGAAIKVIRLSQESSLQEGVRASLVNLTSQHWPCEGRRIGGNQMLLAAVNNHWSSLYL